MPEHSFSVPPRSTTSPVEPPFSPTGAAAVHCRHYMGDLYNDPRLTGDTQGDWTDCRLSAVYGWRSRSPVTVPRVARAQDAHRATVTVRSHIPAPVPGDQLRRCSGCQHEAGPL